MRSFYCLGLVALLVSIAGGLGPLATSLQGESPVTSTVVPSCTINSVPDTLLSYDAVANATSPSQSRASIYLTCTRDTVSTLSLDQGVNAEPGSTCDAPRRRLRSASGRYLSYAFFIDAAYSGVFACGAGNRISGTSTTGVLQTGYNRYTRIVAGQDVEAGVYTDTVTLTVTF